MILVVNHCCRALHTKYYCGFLLYLKMLYQFFLLFRKKLFSKTLLQCFELIYCKIPFFNIGLVLDPIFFSQHRLKQDDGGKSASTQRFLHCNFTLAEDWSFSASDGLLRTIMSSFEVTGWIKWSGEVWDTSCSCREKIVIHMYMKIRPTRILQRCSQCKTVAKFVNSDKW